MAAYDDREEPRRYAMPYAKTVFDMTELVIHKHKDSRRVEVAQIGFHTDKITHAYMNAFIKGSHLI